jgi:site-specific DNA-adenine methylase
MPVIGYPGGKARLSRTIVSFLPKQGRTYVEPFCGRGNLFWSTASLGLRYKKWWLNDIATIPFFDAIQQAGHTLRVPARCKAEYDSQKEAFQSGDLRAILLEPYLSFSGGGYFGAGRKLGGGASAAGYQKTIRQCHRIMQHAKPRLTSLDWRKMGLERLTDEDVVVLDPPYPDSNARSYSDEGLDYESLVDLLLRAKFRWILCGYPHPLLCRLGKPFWARDVRFLCVRNTYHQEERTECLWTNFAQGGTKRHHTLPPSVDGKWRMLADASSLSFSALDAKIEAGLQTVADDWNAVVPYLLEMNRRLSAPGRRTDLRKGAPAELTWTAWVESKRSKIGRSLRSVQRLLRGKTEASKNWKTRPHDSLSSGSEKILHSAMGIAFEMARLILEMRSRSRNTTSNKRRLERFAAQFLSVAERRSVQRSDLTPARRIGIGNRSSGGVMWKM